MFTNLAFVTFSKPDLAGGFGLYSDDHLSGPKKIPAIDQR